MSVEQASSLLSWPLAIVAIAYGAWTFRRYLHHSVALEHAVTAVLAAGLSCGYLLRVANDWGVPDEVRAAIGLALRVVALVMMLGLLWALTDRWRETRALQRLRDRRRKGRSTG